MALSIQYTSSGQGFTVDPGTYQAVLSHIADYGLVEDKKFHPGKLIPKIVFLYQISSQWIKDGVPMYKTVPRFYTASLNEKSNLRATIEALIGGPLVIKNGESFDLESLIGRNCMVNLVRSVKDGQETSYCDVKAVMPLMVGLSPMVRQPQTLPEWIVKKLSAEPPKDPSNNLDLDKVLNWKPPLLPGVAK